MKNKIYGNIGDGYKNFYLDPEIAMYNKYISKLTTIPNGKKQFLYKYINYKYFFVQNTPLKIKDDFGRSGGTFLSECIVLDQCADYPAFYIFSNYFINNLEQLKNHKERDLLVKRYEYNLKDIAFFDEKKQKNIFYLLTQLIESKINDTNLIVKIDNKNFENLINEFICASMLLPKKLSKKISFTINENIFNQYKLSDINLVENEYKITSDIDIKKIIEINFYDIKYQNIDSNNQYVKFLIQCIKSSNFSLINKLFNFIEQEEIEFKDLAEATDVFLKINENSKIDSVDLLVYYLKKSNTEKDVLKAIKNLDDGVKIDIEELKLIDRIVRTKYSIVKSKEYYQFIVLHSLDNHNIFLKIYKEVLSVYFYLLNLYNLNEDKFLEILETEKNFLYKNKENLSINYLYFIYKNEFISLNKLSIKKLKYMFTSNENIFYNLIKDYINLSLTKEDTQSKVFKRNLFDLLHRANLDIIDLLKLINLYKDKLPEVILYEILKKIEETILLENYYHSNKLDNNFFNLLGDIKLQLYPGLNYLKQLYLCNKIKDIYNDSLLNKLIDLTNY